MANKSDGKIVVGPFRGVFPNVFEPAPVRVNGRPVGDPIYGITALFAPDDLEPLKAKVAEVAKATWPGRSLKELQLPFKRGEEEQKKAEAKGKDGSFYAGTVAVKMTSKYQPRVVGPDRNEIVDPGQVYSGAYYYAEVNVVAYPATNANASDGVKCYLNFLMKFKDGTRVAGRTAKDVFAGIEGGSSDYDPTGGVDDEIPF